MRSFLKPTLRSIPDFGPVEPGFTQSYKNVRCATDNEGQLLGVFRHFPDCLTLRDLFETLVDSYSAFNMYGSVSNTADDHSVEWVTYAEFADLVRLTAAEFLNLGIKLGDLIAVIMENSIFFPLAQWVLAYLGAVIVPIDPNRGDIVIRQIISLLNCTGVIFSAHTYSQLRQTFQKAQFRRLNRIFIFSDDLEISRLELNLPQPLGSELVIPVFALPKLLSREQPNSSLQFPPLLATSLCALNIGTGRCGTLNPCCLSHSNLIAAASGLESCDYRFSHDVHLSRISMARIFERSLQLAVLSHGGCVGFSDGAILESMCQIRPTIMAFPGDQIHEMAEALVDQVMRGSWAKRLLCDFMFSIAAQANETHTNVPWIFKRTFFEDLKSIVGGRLKIVISSCWDLQPRIQHILRTLLQIPVIQIYGVTECCGVVCSQRIDDTAVGNVGAPADCCEIRIRDFKEGDQKVDRNESGEVLVRGANLFSGYYRHKVMTSKAISEDGWFGTGDLGRILPDGTLEIVDTIADWHRRRPNRI
jgi:long-chain acyl-CoA synthetase